MPTVLLRRVFKESASTFSTNTTEFFEMPKVHVNAEGLDVSKCADFARWYTQVVTRGGFIRYHDISGCYILRPPAMFIWESIQEYVNKTIKAHGVRNCY